MSSGHFKGISFAPHERPKTLPNDILVVLQPCIHSSRPCTLCRHLSLVLKKPCTCGSKNGTIHFAYHCSLILRTHLHPSLFKVLFFGHLIFCAGSLPLFYTPFFPADVKAFYISLQVEALKCISWSFFVFHQSCFLILWSVLTIHQKCFTISIIKMDKAHFPVPHLFHTNSTSFSAACSFPIPSIRFACFNFCDSLWQ